MERSNRLSRLSLRLVTGAALALALGCSDRSTLIAEPASGSLHGGYEIKLRGEGFENGSIVFMSDKRITDVVYVSSEMIRFRVPPGDKEGPVDIIIANPAGERTLYEKVFRYEKKIGVDVVDAFEKSAGKGADERKAAETAGAADDGKPESKPAESPESAPESTKTTYE